MSGTTPEVPEKTHAQIRYGSHIAIMTGKEAEPVSLEGAATITDLLSELDVKYPGIKALFMPPDDIFNIRTAITLRRAGQPTRGVIDPTERIQDGDILLLW
jgi:hypothetical protein